MRNISTLLALNKLRTEDLSHSDLNELLDYVLSVAYNYIRTKNYKPFITQNNDIIFDAITPLFSKLDSGGSEDLKSVLLNWINPVETELHAKFFLYKIVTNRIEQEITKKLKEADPFFGKILSSVNYYIDASRYEKVSHFGISYIVEKTNNKITRPKIPTESFESLPENLFFEKCDKVIINLMNYLKLETSFFPAIPLNALIKRLKNVFINQMYLYEPSNENLCLDEKLNVEQILNSCLNKTFQRIEYKYYNKGKISEFEKGFFESAFKHIAIDFKNGGMNDELYDYLKSSMNDLSKEEFYRKYHSIMDYLLRLMKKDIIMELKQSENI